MNEVLIAAAGAAFLAGFFGSAHCVGMCGGIAGLFAVKLEIASLSRRLGLGLLYNAGRVVGYATLGFLLCRSLGKISLSLSSEFDEISQDNPETEAYKQKT